MSRWDEEYDLVIVGTGPAGSMFARRVWDQRPTTRILMVDEGPLLSEAPGQHSLTMSAEKRREAWLLARGRAHAAESSRSGVGADGTLVARPGTYLVRDRGGEAGGMPAAALSSAVGGMGVFWTCACPPPVQSERVPFLSENGFDDALLASAKYLGARADAFAASPLQRAIIDRLGALFDDAAERRRVQPLPLAAEPFDGAHPRWLGPSHILQERKPDPSWLRPSTLCRRVITTDGIAEAVELVDLITETSYRVGARAVVIAADALRTPQLLYASGMVSDALGRYLNDQPQVTAMAKVNGIESVGGESKVEDLRDNVAGVVWVPYSEPAHPFHGQVLQLNASPVGPDGTIEDSESTVILSWFVPPELRRENRVRFDATESDVYGMPAIHIEYSLSEADLRHVEDAKARVREVAGTLGELRHGADPRLLPAGSSLHYQGSVRMGVEDDGASVCDRNSIVWGTSNLYVAGNGVIPTSTACNPTLFAGALAVMAADHFAAAAPSSPE